MDGWMDGWMDHGAGITDPNARGESVMTEVESDHSNTRHRQTQRKIRDTEQHDNRNSGIDSTITD